MLTDEQLGTALRNADAAAQAGDEQARSDARALSEEYMRRKSLRTERPGFGRPEPDLTGGSDAEYRKRFNRDTTLGQLAANKAKQFGAAVASIPGFVADIAAYPADVAGTAAQNMLAGIGLAPPRKGPEAVFQAGPASHQAVSRVLGVDPNLKPASPGQEFLANAAIDIPTNLALTGLTGGFGLAGRAAMHPINRAGFDALSGLGTALASTATKEQGVGTQLTAGLLMGAVVPSLFLQRADTVQKLWNLRSKSPAEMMDAVQKNPKLVENAKTEIQDEIARQVREGNPETYREAIRQAKVLEEAIPGLKLDIGQTSMIPSVQDAVKRVKAGHINATRASQEAQQGALRGALGPEAGSEDAARGIIQQRVQSTEDSLQGLRRAETGMGATLAERSGIAAPMTGSAVTEAGDAAIAARRALMDRTRATEVAPRAQRVVEAGRGIQFNAAPIVNEAESLLQRPILQYDAQNAPQIVRTIRERFRPEGDAAAAAVPTATSIDDLMAMRQAVNQDIAAEMASKSPLTGERRRALMGIKASIDDTIERSGNQGVVDAYTEFNRYYSQDFAPRFLRGVNMQPDVRRFSGDAMMTPENAFSKWFTPGGRESFLNAGRFARMFADDPAQMGNMRKFVLDKYYHDVIAKSADGIIDLKRHEAFMSRMRYGGALEALEKAGLPVRKELMDNAAAVQSTMAMRAENLAAQKALQSDRLFEIMQTKWTQRDPVTGKVNMAADPADVFGKALDNPTDARGMAMRLTPEESKVVGQYTREQLANRFVQNGEVNIKEMSKFLESPAQKEAALAFLRRDMGSEGAQQYMRRLELVKQAAERIETTNVTASVSPGKGNIWADSLTKEVGFSWKQLAQYTRGAVLGNVSPQTMGLVLSAQAFGTVRRNQRDAVFRALMDDKSDDGLRLINAIIDNPNASAGTLSRFGRWMTEKVPGFLSSFVGMKHYPAGAARVAAGNIENMLPQGEQQELGPP